eukprot:TRINITY_DN6163_c0_g1_i1.p1 TRINITY_DN6163_c0_g1~~TRINITY_DN6163_c0_g1_i1.p1  ORF type:complete len:651 (-),score=131.63 TRINITY_DN6163_c0_g1_i1:1301-3253(-)
MDEYPFQLKQLPVPVIELFCENLEFGETIKSLISKKQDIEPNRPTINVLLSEIDAKLPKPRNRQSQNYAGYHPTGILPAGWLYQQFEVFPAVVGFVIHKDSLEDGSHLMELLEKAEDYLKPLSVRFLIVLMKDDEEELDPRPVNILKKYIDVRNVIVFTVPKSDSSIRVLEKLLLKKSYEYYNEEQQTIKSYRDRMNKSNQQRLFVRHNFQIAYLSEFRENRKRCLKYYNAAYVLLNESHSAKRKKNIVETKTIAELINFKICSHLMDDGRIDDAINQFKYHMATYKNDVGDPVLEFQHYNWIGRQYQTFGELMDSHGEDLQANSRTWHHPGFYYHAASSNYQKRRAIISEYSKEENENIEFLRHIVKPYVPTLVDVKIQNYYGRDLELVALHEHEEINPEDYSLFEIHVAQELNVDHNELILSQLRRSYFRYRSDGNQMMRTIWNITSELSEEYFISENYENAKKFIDALIEHYNEDKWWDLLVHSLKLAVSIAEKTEDLENIVIYSLRLLSPHLNVDLEERKDIFSKVNSIVKENKIMAILDVPYHDPLVEVYIQFENDAVFTRKEFKLMIKVKSNFPSKSCFGKLVLELSDSSVLSIEHNEENDTENLSFSSGEIKYYTFNLDGRDNTEILSVYIRSFPYAIFLYDF